MQYESVDDEQLHTTPLWAGKTAEEWVGQENKYHTGKSQTIWFIIIAAECEGVSDIHDMQFLRKWYLDVPYNVFFSGKREELDIEFQRYKEHILTQECFLAEVPKIEAQSERKFQIFSYICNRTNFIKFMACMRDTKLEREQSADVQFSLLEEVGLKMKLGETELNTLKRLYQYLVNILLEDFKSYKLRSQSSYMYPIRDLLQDSYSDIVDAIVSFSFWETAMLKPAVTLNRLLAYMKIAAQGYRRNTDAINVSINFGVNKRGKITAIEEIEGTDLATDEAAIAEIGYLELQQVIKEEADRLGLEYAFIDMLNLISDGISIKEVATMYRLNESSAYKNITKLRKAVASRIDSEKKVGSKSELNPVWAALLDDETRAKLKVSINNFSLRYFYLRAIQLAIKIADELNTENLDIIEAKEIIINYVAKNLQIEFPNVSKNIKVAESTATRNIKKAYNIIIGSEKFVNKKSGRRSSSFVREQEIKDWVNFVASHPEWKSYFTTAEQDIISLYYLTEQKPGKYITQADVSKLLGIDNTRVSRKLEDISQKLIIIRWGRERKR